MGLSKKKLSIELLFRCFVKVGLKPNIRRKLSLSQKRFKRAQETPASKLSLDALLFCLM